jgi:prepilin-type N-terminal cleavage/methylation domain-containing protein
MRINRIDRRGYTVVELITVIIMLGVLSVIGLVGFLLIKILWDYAF